MALDTDPDQTIQQSLAIENLLGFHAVDIAGCLAEGFTAFIGELIVPGVVFCQDERLHLADVTKVLFGKTHPLQSVDRTLDEFLGSFSSRGKYNVADLTIEACRCTSPAKLGEEKTLPIGILLKLLLEAAAVGRDLAQEVARGGSILSPGRRSSQEQGCGDDERSPCRREVAGMEGCVDPSAFSNPRMSLKSVRAEKGRLQGEDLLSERIEGFERGGGQGGGGSCAHSCRDHEGFLELPLPLPPPLNVESGAVRPR